MGGRKIFRGSRKQWGWGSLTLYFTKKEIKFTYTPWSTKYCPNFSGCANANRAFPEQKTWLPRFVQIFRPPFSIAALVQSHHYYVLKLLRTKKPTNKAGKHLTTKEYSIRLSIRRSVGKTFFQCWLDFVDSNCWDVRPYLKVPNPSQVVIQSV